MSGRIHSPKVARRGEEGPNDFGRLPLRTGTTCLQFYKGKNRIARIAVSAKVKLKFDEQSMSNPGCNVEENESEELAVLIAVHREE